MLLFLILLVIVLVVTNINSIKKYREAVGRLDSIETDYQELLYQIEVKEQELETLKSLGEKSDR